MTRLSRYCCALVAAAGLFFLLGESFAQQRQLQSMYLGAYPAVVDTLSGSPIRFLEPGELVFDPSGGRNMGSAESVGNLAAAFLLRYASLFRTGEIDLGSPVVRKHARFYTIEYEQRANGRRVLDSYVGVTVGFSGNVVAAGASVFPEASVVGISAIDGAMAVAVTRQQAAIEASATVRSAEAVFIPEATELGYQLVPAFEVTIDDAGKGATYRGVIDGRNGNVNYLGEHRLDLDAHPVTDEPRTTVVESFTPIEPAALSSTNSIYGTVTLNYYVTPDDYNNDELERNIDQPFKGARVDIDKVGGGYSTTVYANSSGYYSDTGMPTGTYDVTFVIENEKASVSGIHSSWREHTEQVYVASGVQCDYDWGYGQGGDRDQSGSAYALNNVYHVYDSWDYFRNDIGTSFADSVLFMSVVIDTVNKDGSTSPPSNWINIGRENALSSEILNHEYAHNMVWWFYGKASIYNGTGTQDPYRDYNESYAMEEGFADMYTTYMTGDNAMGGPGSTAGEPSFRSGHGTSTIRLLYNYLTMSDYVDDYASRHANGKIIGGAMWNLRTSLGATDAEELAVDAMVMTPRAQSFLGYRNNLEAADQNANSGANLQDIELRFFTKEIGTPNPPTSVTVTDLGYKTQITWNDKSGLEDSYELWRKPHSGSWSQIGSSMSPNTTSVLDDAMDCESGAFYYKVIVEADGVTAESPQQYYYNCAPKRQPTGDLANTELDLQVVLAPNPTSDPAAIQVVLTKEAEVRVAVFDMLGRRVFEANRQRPAGMTVINVPGLRSGAYFYRVEAEQIVKTGSFLSVGL